MSDDVPERAEPAGKDLDADLKDFDPIVGLNTDSLSDLLGYHVRMAYVTMLRDFTDALSGLDLTQKQGATLRLIAANLGASQIDLAAALSTDRSTMMAVVDRLESRGLIVRKRSAADRRRQELHLTREGEEILARSSELIADHERRFTERYSPKELAQMIDWLKRIYEH